MNDTKFIKITSCVLKYCRQLFGSLMSQWVKIVPAVQETIGDTGVIPGLGRSSGEGNGNALQDSCLGNPMARGAWGLQSKRSQRVSTTERRQQQHSTVLGHIHV